MIVLILLMRKSGYCYKLLRESKNWCFWTVVLEKTLESPLDSKEIQPIHPKGNQSWIVTGKTDAETETLATWCEELTHLKRPWCWERLKAGEEVDDRGWNGWMASPTQWTWVWASSGRWWRTGKSGELQPMTWGHKESYMAEWMNRTELHLWNPLALHNKFTSDTVPPGFWLFSFPGKS